jgi:hypothetical protein
MFFTDPNVSLKALDQSWKLDGSYTEEQPEPKFNFQVAVMNVKDLEKELKKINQELGELDDDVIDVEVTKAPDGCPDDRLGDGK